MLAVFLLLIGCPDSAGDNNGNGNGDAPAAMTDTTAPDAVTNVTATPLPSGTQVLLRWDDSSSDDVATITISWSSTAAGILAGSDTAEVGAEQSTIGSLAFATPYTFVITVADAAGNNSAATPVPVNTLPNPIDADGNALIDINSLERLYNIRYNLDVGAAGDDGRYKESTQMADGAGILCGTDAATPCSGYELTRNLDFTDAGNYDSGEVNNDWRPNNSDPATATNAGWPPIGSCNSDTTDGDTVVCGDNDDTPFAARFEGNGYSISNLYTRNTDDNSAAAIGLFGTIGDDAIIDTVGVVDAFVYGSDAAVDYVGALVGFSNGGSIIASYASGSTADGGMGGSDRVGGLVGFSNGNITASYANDSTADGGMGGNDRVGALVGFSNGNITASYTHNSTADGGAGDTDHVGGLVGFSFNGSISTSYVTGGTANGSMGDSDAVGGLVGSNDTSNITASYASSTVNGGMGDTDRIGGLVGINGGTITASYASSTADGGMGDTDRIGGLVGDNSGTVSASYATGTANGGADNDDIVGGLVGDNSFFGNIIASYATTAADGGSGSDDTVGNLVGRNTDTDFALSGTITASYGFGATDNVGTAGLSQGPDGRPTDSTVDSTSESTGAALLLAPNPSDSTNTAVAAVWNQTSSNTAGAWDFGSTSNIPALHYADYDGDGDTYGCGSASTATIVIPDSIPNGMGGTIDIECGTTLLPGQGR